MQATYDYAYLRPRVGIKRAIAVSIALHAVAVLVFAWLAQRPVRIHNTREPIVTKLVKLGEVRKPELLPVKDTVPPPAPVAPPVAKPEVPVPPPAPTPVVAPTPVPVPPPKAVPVPTPEPKKTPPPPPAPKPPAQAESPPAQSRASAMANAFAGIEKAVQADRPPVGDPEGSPDGTETDPRNARRVQMYYTLLDRHIRRQYVLPSIITDRERMFLKAVVAIYIGEDGTLLRQEFVDRSGNPHFDTALESAVTKSSPLPAPPPELRAQLRTEGVELLFRP